jgi:hypothetical protein
MKILIRLMILPVLIWPYSGVVAQNMSVPVGQQAPGLQGMAVPNRGMTEQSVESGFGTPIMKNGPVGEPPITYWEYDNYFVYFDTGRVLHTVLKHRE